MNDVNKSFLAAGAVVLAAGAVVAGSVARDRVDLGAVQGPASVRSLSTETLLASRDLSQGGVPVDSFFVQMTDLLKREYVEPIKDETKLATGAVRGMVTSLGDPNSLYFDKDQFRVYRQAINGVYEGIGADFVLDLSGGTGAGVAKGGTQTGSSGEVEDAAQQTVTTGVRIPKLVIASVVRGGPADRAGVKVGDWVETVNGHHVVNPLLVQDFRRIQQLAQKPDADPAELNRLRQDLAQKMDGSIMPLRARDKLTIGAEGTVNVGWRRAGQSVTTNIVKAGTREKLFDAESGRLRVAKGAIEPLKEYLAGKSAVTLDLRGNANGDPSALRPILALLAPDGQYGSFVNERKRQAQALTVKGGNPKPPKLTLLVDSSTRGPAEILALALSSKGRATLSGGKTPGTRELVEIVSLADGSGYTLVTGKYQVGASKAGGKTR